MKHGELGTHPHPMDDDPEALMPEPVPLRPTTTIGAPVDSLDLATLVKMWQAVSGEIVLWKVIDTLMAIAVEQAGAERGLLIRPRGDEQRIEAEATTGRDKITVYLRQVSVTPAELPASVLYHVVRTREGVILDNASAPNQFSGDEDIRQKGGPVGPLPAADEAGSGTPRGNRSG